MKKRTGCQYRINQMSKRTKFIITLAVSNADELDLKYDLHPPLPTPCSQFEHTAFENPSPIAIVNKTTSIADLTPAGPVTMSFLGATKHVHKCNISQIDFNTNKVIDECRSYNCYWCRHPIETRPIGCPLSHQPGKSKKEYVSVINQTKYRIEENTHSIPEDAAYTTDGVFCSFNCCVSYIHDKKGDDRYEHSHMLLLKMHRDMSGFGVSVIPPAPDWRSLSLYGGWLDIEGFRKSFDNTEFEERGLMLDIPVNMMSVSNIYERRLKF